MKKKIAAIIMIMIIILNNINLPTIPKVLSKEVEVKPYAIAGLMALYGDYDNTDPDLDPDIDNEPKINCNGTGRYSGDGGTSWIDCPGCDHPNCPVSAGILPKQIEPIPVNTIKTDIQKAEDIISDGLNFRVILVSDSDWCKPCKISKQLIIDEKLSTADYKNGGWTYGKESSNLLQIIDTADKSLIDDADLLRTYVNETIPNPRQIKNFGLSIPLWIRIVNGKVDAAYQGKINFDQFNSFIRYGVNSKGFIIDNKGNSVLYKGP